MTKADLLIKLPRQKLAEMIIELEHQLQSSEERSFGYAAKLVALTALEANEESGE